MPKLTLKFKDVTVAEYELEKGKSLKIGRRNDNDVVINNLAVSGHHAKIDSIGDEFVLIDLQSKNGSFVNEQQVTSHWLNQGDVISIGKHALLFSYADGEARPESHHNEMEKTMVMDTSQYRSMVKKSNPKESPAPEKKKRGAAILTYLAGGDGDVELKNKLIKIGKDPSADIVVAGFAIGKTAATISKRPDGFYLSYVGGLSKPKVNDKAVKQSIFLNDLDIIDIGSTKLQFFLR